MALRIGRLIEYGQFNNTKQNSVRGWLKLEGYEQMPHIELTGDMSPDLAGKRFAFWPNPDYPLEKRVANGVAPGHVSPRHIGPTGMMTAARWVKHIVEDPDVISRGDVEEAPLKFEWKRCLYLEWFSQNGRVLIEMIDPLLQEYKGTENGEDIWEDFPPLMTDPTEYWNQPDSDGEHDAADLARTTIPFGSHYRGPRADGGLNLPGDITTGDAPDDNSNLDDYFESLSKATDVAAGLAQQEPEYDHNEFIREMDYMEEVMEGSHDNDPLLGTVLDIPVVGNMTDAQAESKLKETLAILAMHNIAINVCDHFSTKDLLRLIRDDYGINIRIHPGFVGGDCFTHYSTWESCRECDAEFELKYQAEQAERDAKVPGQSYQASDDDNPDMPF